MHITAAFQMYFEILYMLQQLFEVIWLNSTMLYCHNATLTVRKKDRRLWYSMEYQPKRHSAVYQAGGKRSTCAGSGISNPGSVQNYTLVMIP